MPSTGQECALAAKGCVGARRPTRCLVAEAVGRWVGGDVAWAGTGVDL
jgi:hypothetical protein